MCWPCPNARHWTGFHQSGGSPPSWEAWGLEGVNCIMAGPDVVQQTGAQVLDQSPSPCHNSCLAQSNVFYVRWLTCCAASGRRTILSALIRSFIMICSGGTSSWSNGMGLASGFFQEYTCSRRWSFLQHGWFLGLWHFGAPSGAGSMFCFAQTTTAWSTSSMLGLPKYHVFCFCYVLCYWQPPVIVSQELPIRLLMLFPALIGRISTVWLQKLILIPPRFHHSCCRTSSHHFRSAALFLFGPGSSSIYSQILQLSLSLSPSAVSWVGSICLGVLAQLMNGRSACLLRFWPVPCSIPPSTCTSLVSEPCISNKVSPTLVRTVFACSVSFVASRALRVFPHLAVCQLWMTLCWSSGCL